MPYKNLTMRDGVGHSQLDMMTCNGRKQAGSGIYRVGLKLN